jgi:hypothetical protein
LKNVAENIGLFRQPRAKEVVEERKFFLDYHSSQLPETFQGVQLDLPMQKWGLSRQCKENKFNILKRL